MLAAALRPLRMLLQVLAFALFFVGGALLAWLLMPLAWLTSREPERRVTRAQRLLAAAFNVFHGYWRLCCLVWFPRPRHLDLPEGPCVIVANHPTLIDVTILVARLGPVHCVAKASWFSNPLVGPLLRLCQYLRGGPDRTAALLEDAGALLARGRRLLIFPEGTRSPDGDLGPFKRGAFEIARRADVPVVALLARCQPPFLNHRRRWFWTPRRVPRYTVSVLTTFHHQDFGGRSKPMCRHAERAYRDRLGLPPQGPESGATQRGDSHRARARTARRGAQGTDRRDADARRGHSRGNR